MARAIVLFDGVCNLCNGAVRFIAANDPHGHFAFRPLQSAEGERLPNTIVLLEYGRRFEESDAVLHIALGLRMPWPLAFAAILVPRGVRDGLYRWIARNRYRWFGRLDTCQLPSARLRERFLDET